MTIKQMKAIEDETLELLRMRSQAGDNEAAMVILDHLRETSKLIDQWKRNKTQEEREGK